VDRLGKLLRRQGVVGDIIDDVLEQQERGMPLASLCYVLGHLDEETLVRALAKQAGAPGIVLDQSVIRLDCLEGVPHELMRRNAVLPVFEDDARVFVAVEGLRERSEILRQIELFKGKAVVPHVALQITLARTLRACLAAAARGERYHVGHYATFEPGSAGAMAVVSEVETCPDSAPEARAHEAVVEDVTKELVVSDLILIDEDRDSASITIEADKLQADARGAADGETDSRPTDPSLATISAESLHKALQTSDRDLDLDRGEGRSYDRDRQGPLRVLVVDDDFAFRNLLVKELAPAGFQAEVAATGGEAVRLLRHRPPDLVVVDVMLPEIDGFQICRAIKQSRRYGGIPVLLMSAVIDSTRVTDEVLARYGADAYFEKPIDVPVMVARALELARQAKRGSQAQPVDDRSFEEGMNLYRQGRLEEAIAALQAGLEVDPLSAKHHFVLANLFQKKQMIYEAIDEYEATAELKPDYFPALTRLAYLSYKKGFSARAIETWRRALPHCPDPSLRENIEVFMRKLIADMRDSPVVG
jgi:DNA-binding response OmpR family regulator